MIVVITRSHYLERASAVDFKDAAARGKFVSGAKVLAAVRMPSISQPRRVYEDRLEAGGAGKELSTNNEIQSFGRVVFWNGE